MQNIPDPLTSFEQYFAHLKRSQTPAVLWYSGLDERIELSGKVLENWVSKTANFLVEECDVEAEQTVSILMQTHWRSIIIALAALRVGAHLRFTADDSDVIFSASNEQLEQLDAEYRVIVDKGPLSPRYMGTLPAEVLDYCAEVRSYGDVYSAFEIPSLHSESLEGITAEEILHRISAQAEQVNSEEAQAHAVALHTPPALNAEYLMSTLAVLYRHQATLVLDPAHNWDKTQVQQILDAELAVRVAKD
ncbi:MAG: TIGR03089 family protein [Rothia sp. (in: high G+C Gram-positive bacteria)]|nr:TIGR03089 family protein [Rothia sp. (in: high G+C Gram-positive bacteria)]